ncbi:MAG: SMP-30/gluconolactonase/LRE family protein [Saprospiraceae bacterium]|nr:MAG: SMP-30/gluconolactonase/LRE family protein [Saprospiraceae bacterium]
MKNFWTLLLFAGLLTSACTRQKTTEQKEAPRPTYPSTGTIERLSPALNDILADSAKIEILAEGYQWTEGPVWVAGGEYLLFSDVPANQIIKWKEGQGASLYLTPSGYTGDTTQHREGSNGLLLDDAGHLVLCQHGDRRMALMDAPVSEPKPAFTTLTGQWKSKRFNSPNDACFDSHGNLYITDPPYGLPLQDKDPSREIPFQGVYRLHTNGTMELLIDSLSRPNGIALSPDEKTLYISNSDPARAIWMAYDIQPDGTLANGRVFYDATANVTAEFTGLPDGMKVSPNGILFATGPSALYIFKPDGTLLGKIITGVPNSNCAFGNGGKALYITSNHSLTRVWLK